jgi:UDP-N-acetylglucosamine 2-epimerase (non-hydrolysing)
MSSSRNGTQGNTICALVGTRPDIIKMSPVLRALKNNSADFFVVHSGQHYSPNMDAIFFDELELDKPEYRVDTKQEAFPGEQTADMLRGIEKVLLQEKPKLVLVYADLNTTLAGALAARKLHMRIGYVEAGLRSFDWRMPEEHNRIMVGHICEYLFAPTELAKENLERNGVRGKIFVTGNTIVDAVEQNLKLASAKSSILQELSLTSGNYILVTCHREENVDSRDNLESILESLREVTKKYTYECIYPIHPRTQKRLTEFGLELPDSVRSIGPLGYLDFLKLEANAKIILTDSGGIQEEACVMQVPCVTLRDNTERPETVDVGANIVAGVRPQNVLNAVEQMLGREMKWVNPFGDGTSGEKIVRICLEEMVKEDGF